MHDLGYNFSKSTGSKLNFEFCNFLQPLLCNIGGNKCLSGASQSFITTDFTLIYSKDPHDSVCNLSKSIGSKPVIFKSAIFLQLLLYKISGNKRLTGASL